MSNLPAIKIQRTGTREVDDLQMQVKTAMENLSSGPLALAHLTEVSCHYNQPIWAAGGADYFYTLRTFNSKERLVRACWVNSGGVAANAVNYRTINLYHVTGAAGANVIGIASINTTTQDLPQQQPVDFQISAGPQDLIFDRNEVLTLYISGGGGKPQLDSGALSIFFEKVQ